MAKAHAAPDLTSFLGQGDELISLRLSGSRRPNGVVTDRSATAGAPSATASPRDPALVAARSIAALVSGFQPYRLAIAQGQWTTDADAAWQVRSRRTCLAELARLGVPARFIDRPFTTPVPNPVTLKGPVLGVSFYPLQPERQIELDCDLAARLPTLSRILKAHGVRQVGVNSSYRDKPRPSFHTFGMAIDLAVFRTRTETFTVNEQFEVTPDLPTCDAQPLTTAGKRLLAIACELAASHVFTSVLTPNYNAGHRDHFHLDIRPDDARFFVR